MYVRFIVLTPGRRPAPGLFRSGFHPDDDPALPNWIRQAAREHYAWFNVNLAVPRRFTAVSRRRHVDAGICWFKPTAREHIARARELALLIAEADHPTAMLTTRHLGQVLYRDDVQIVAKPDARTRISA
jgi:hypothetical protein